jgi:hypothetical protein
MTTQPFRDGHFDMVLANPIHGLSGHEVMREARGRATDLLSDGEWLAAINLGPGFAEPGDDTLMRWTVTYRARPAQS